MSDTTTDAPPLLCGFCGGAVHPVGQNCRRHTLDLMKLGATVPGMDVVAALLSASPEPR